MRVLTKSYLARSAVIFCFAYASISIPSCGTSHDSTRSSAASTSASSADDQTVPLTVTLVDNQGLQLTAGVSIVDAEFSLTCKTSSAYTGTPISWPMTATLKNMQTQPFLVPVAIVAGSCEVGVLSLTLPPVAVLSTTANVVLNCPITSANGTTTYPSVGGAEPACTPQGQASAESLSGLVTLNAGAPQTLKIGQTPPSVQFTASITGTETDASATVNASASDPSEVTFNGIAPPNYTATQLVTAVAQAGTYTAPKCQIVLTATCAGAVLPAVATGSTLASCDGIAPSSLTGSVTFGTSTPPTTVAFSSLAANTVGSDGVSAVALTSSGVRISLVVPSCNINAGAPISEGTVALAIGATNTDGVDKSAVIISQALTIQPGN